MYLKAFFKAEIKFHIIFFTLLILIFCTPSTASSQGLGFNSSYDKTISKRTSYTVFANGNRTINDYLTVSFDLSIKDLKQFGYICTVNLNEDKCIYSLSFFDFNGENFLKFNKEGENNLLTIPLTNSDLEMGRWNKIELNFDFSKNNITVFVNAKRFNCKDPEISKTEVANVFFGKHANIIDLPDFAIKNLVIKDARTYNKFIFYEDAGNKVHNEQGQAIGHVENPKWLVNDSYHWKYRYAQKCNSVSVVQYNCQKNQLIIAESDSVTLVNINSGTFARKEYANQLQVPLNLGMSCMKGNDLLIYELKNLNLEAPTIATLDLKNYKWGFIGYKRLNNERHHHNAYLDTAQQQLYIFGGFGDKKYYNSLHCFDLSSDSLYSLKLSGDQITPRFFAGMGNINNELIVFGGSGNSAGDQTIGRKYFYDCYSIDIKNRQSKKLWEINRGETRLVTSRNLIFAPDSNSFYALCYPEYNPNTFLKLYNYNLNDGNFSILGDSIPMISEEIKTNASLYLNSKTDEIYAVIQEFQKDKSCIVKVYSINNPPLSLDYFNDKIEKYPANRRYIFMLASVFLFSLLIALLIIWKKKHKLKTIINESVKLQNLTADNQGPTKNAIYLFGEFTVLDRLGKDISYLFSPQMKELLLLILDRSIDGTGVSSEQIYELIWPEKELKNAKNLKGVTINKIRHILSDMEGIELVFENKNFLLKTAPSFYIDYQKLVNLYTETKLQIENKNIESINSIISKGKFLKLINIEWLDPFKARVSDQILEIAPHILKNLFNAKEYAACIIFAKNLYYTDELNDYAFFFITQSFLALDRKVEAKKHYSKFTNRYQKIQSEDYGLLFSDVVKESKKYVKSI